MQILKDRSSRIYGHLEETLTAENIRARDLEKIVPVACDIAITIFELKGEGLEHYPV
jgi:hypothetical protein